MRRPDREIQQAAGITTRRGLLLGGAQLAVMGVLGWRMQSMQLDQSEEFALLAEENRVNLRLIPPERGLIFDRNGLRLAENGQNYRIVIIREDAGDVDDTLARLARLIPVPPEAIEEAKVEMARRSPFAPVPILERVAWEHVTRVEVNRPALPGIFAEVGLSRLYPQGKDLAHVVGYVGPISDYDLREGYLSTDTDPLLREIPRLQVGKTGVEAKLEQNLRGSAGTSRLEVNAAGRIMRELDRQSGTTGQDIQLTIDTSLQSYVQARLDNEPSASAVVIDLEDGDLRAITSSPSFDPNLFVRGISVADWDALNERELPADQKKRALAAKAVQDAYPPGSTFKMITALAALEAGEIDSEETVNCVGQLEVADVRFHCWKRSGHGNMNLHEGLKQSCDVYYYDISQRVGIDKIAEMARRLGVGIAHDLPLSAVSNGIAPDKAWKRRVRNAEWRIGDTVNASIGQGYVLASPLQLAVMTARIATGDEIVPRLVRSRAGVPMPSGRRQSLGLNENFLRRIRAAMFDVVNARRGTSYINRIEEPAARMSGKTGTAQVRRITEEEREAGVIANEDLPWERRDHALFVCFAPAENPRFAVSVVVEHGGGSAAAATIARDIMLQALYDGTPPLDAYPSADRQEIRSLQEQIELRQTQRAADRQDRA